MTSTPRQRLGALGETVARKRLEAAGYRVLETNYRAKAGEIDLVAEHGPTLVFVEVRTRSTQSLGSPEESLTPKKRSHMADAAQEYLQAKGAESRDWRIDLAAVILTHQGRLLRFDVIRNAIEV